MSYLTEKKIGIPIAIICKNNSTKVISIANDDNEDKCESNKKQCCKKCTKKCKGGCCKKCCKAPEYSDEEEDNNDSLENSSDDDLNDEDLELLDNKYYKDMGFHYRINVDKIKKNIKDKKANKKLVRETKKYIENKKNKEIIIHDGEVQVLPKFNERECIYVAGPSGSGKSTYIANYASEYKRMYPKNNIFIFSRVANDECIDRLKPTRIMINEELIEDPIRPDELSNSLVIFDDTDTIPNKKLKDTIISLKNDLLETGRHEDIYVAITSHLISNYRETRTVLNEAHSITVFPQGGSTYSIKYVLKNYGGMDKNDVQKAISLPSRWITLKKTFPQAIIYAKGTYLLK